ncbi:tetratricopeptide repeat protein [Hymenobacter lapidiphilus]|uniref:Tol-pal system protein YbgF n=1 Tax=Hymenobacter lapidiphilus TaxID=2608003 RepID=A0A7Y7U686_9BACT|nr:tol-pal system protein YbgF [Hymenobacter lapidiphilus]NVO32112.1 tol-pal system protein YbgF [Hymenobacter lapidiphilus]
MHQLLQLLFFLLLLLPWVARAQQPVGIPPPPPPSEATRSETMGPDLTRPDLLPDSTRQVKLENVDVAPATVDISGWLLLDKDIQTELEGAVYNLYNFKYDKAERQFRSLRRRYPNHPMPYFLLGLSAWWKIVPTGIQTKLYDRQFFAYMDTTITKAEALYKKDNKNYEACFFLAAGYGFDARLHAERRDWRKATVSAKRALDYLEKSKEANDLSPEFLFGQALFNYYAVWVPENYPLLKPVLLFFPKGNKQLGLQQLRNVAENGFYVGPEARTYLMRILLIEEDKPAEALPVARYLATTYPENAFFQRHYANACFREGQFRECERVSRDLLDKLGRGLPGYEANGGRYATYFLAYFMQHKYKDLAKARDYYQRCIVFAEQNNETNYGFYVFANLALARLATDAKDGRAARRYYAVVLEKSDRKSDQYKEARGYLKVK